MSEPATPPIERLLRHRAWLRRLAASLVVDAARADDLAQEALLQALDRPPARSDHPRAWLGTVARNLARKLSSSERRRTVREHATAAPESLPPTDEIVARAALQHEVSAAVLALAEPYRSALLLHFFDGLPPRTIAKRTDSPVETVRTRIKRGVELVRAEIVHRRGVDLGGAAGDGAARREWAVGLLGLLDPWARRAVRHALLTKTSIGVGVGAGAGAGFSAAGVLGVMGVIAMSTKIKLAAAAIVVAAGAFTIVKLRETPDSLPRPALASDHGGPPGLPAPASAAAPPLPVAAEATRAPESDTSKDHAPSATPSAPAATASIEGIVRTEMGVPVSGVLVVADVVDRVASLGTLFELARGAEGLLREGEPAKVKVRTMTGADGRFRLDGLPAPANVDVAAVHREWGMALEAGRVLDPALPPLQVDLTLVAGTVIHGTVTDRHGEPIRGARVGITVAERKRGGMSKSTLLSVDTADDGSYRTLALPFRDFAVDASAPGFTDQEHDPVTPLPSEHECRSDFVLEPARRIAGRIVTADGAPAQLDRVAREFVLIGSSSDPANAVGGSESLGMHGVLSRDPDGYELVDSWEIVKWVSLWCDEKLLGAVAAGGAGDGDASEGESAADAGPDLVVDLSRIPPAAKKGSLRIVVVDAASGAPLADFDLQATIDLHGAFGSRPKLDERSVRGSDGSVVLEGLAVGDWLVGVRAAGFTPRLTSARVSDDVTGSTVQIALAHGERSIAGRVVDETGAPIGGAGVVLLGADGGVVLPDPDYRTITNAEGRFGFGSLPDGDYSVVAELQSAGSPFDPKLAPAAAAARAGANELVLTLRAGVVVQLQPRRGERSFDSGFALRIRDERGVPVFDQLRPGRSSKTFSSSFPVRLAPGSYTVEFIAQGHHGGPQRFLAAPEAKVPVEIVPLAAER